MVTEVEAGVMGVICYRCPKTREDVVTAIETSRDTLLKMRSLDLTIWAWCPHCVAGHQIKPADASLQENGVRVDLDAPLAAKSA
jgi:hypothetical protein